MFETGNVITYSTRVIDGSETVVVSGSEYPANTYQGYKIASASITYEVVGEDGTNTWNTVEIPHSSDECGYVRCEDLDNGLFGIVWENGTVFATGKCVNTRYQVSVVVDGYNFPVVENNLIRRKGTHLVSGWNRFFGFVDTNNNGEYDVGEPAGISINGQSLVSYDTASATIPLTDGLFGYPRFSWPVSNDSENGYYTVEIWRSKQGTENIDTKITSVKIAKPRNFFHEGDLVAAGINGLPFGSNTSSTFYWVVYDGTDTTSALSKQIYPVVGSGSASSLNAITYNYEGVSSDDNGWGYSINSDTGRRTMKAIYPQNGETVHGPLVDFRWTMDHRTEGVTVTIRNDDTGTVLMDKRVVPLPWRHGAVADGRMPSEYTGYYSACPQIEAASGQGYLELPSGTYSYTITERVNSTAFTPQSISGKFVIENTDAGQGRSAIKGKVYYFGRALNGRSFPYYVRVQAFALPESATSGAAPSGNPVAVATVGVAREVDGTPGEFVLHGLTDGKYAVLAFLDQNGNGRADEWETQGYAVVEGTASPVFYGTPDPLVIDGRDLEDVSIVLHPRDTDNDGLWDDWEWKTSQEYLGKASISSLYGSMCRAGSAKTFRQEMADAPIGAVAGTPYFYPAGIDPDDLVSLGVDVRPVTLTKTFFIPAPRTFLHEGDFDDAGFYGFPMGKQTNSIVSWSAYAVSPLNGQIGVGAGSFVEYAGPKGDRREMKIGYPDQCTTVLGSDVEFTWQMDYRNAGVEFVIERYDGGSSAVTNADGSVTMLPYPRQFNTSTDPWSADDHWDSAGASWTTVFSGIVPFPVRHGLNTSSDYYFTAYPQLEDGRKHIDFAAGWYRYRITERPMTDAYKPQSVTGSFTVSADTEDSLANLYNYTASGSVFYFGKVFGGLREDTLADSLTEIATLDGTETSVNAEYTGEVRPGAMLLRLVDADGTVIASAGDRATTIASEGRFAVDGDTIWSGSIIYPEEEGEAAKISLVFNPGAEPPPAGSKILVGPKAFGDGRKIIVQAFKLPDNAEHSASISGHPVAQIEMESKGAFEIKGLAKGKYAFRGFLDSNGNGIADDWETQGVGMLSPTMSPVLSRDASVIELKDDVRNIRIILYDRDTDADKLPDAWEYQMFGAIDIADGNDRAPDDDTGALKLWQEYADGELDADPRTPDTDLDGLTDTMEILITGTDSEKRDTDDDGIGDLEEFLSGSDPLDPNVAIPYTMPALAFDEDGAPYVDCEYPALPRGVVLTYELQRKATLDAKEWEVVDSIDVAAFDRDDLVRVENMDFLPAGVMRMTPADKLDTLEWKAGFFRVRIFADYGKYIENEDGTTSYWAWSRNGDFVEVARGTGVLVRDALGTWSFVEKDEHRTGTLVRKEDGNWKFNR